MTLSGGVFATNKMEDNDSEGDDYDYQEAVEDSNGYFEPVLGEAGPSLEDAAAEKDALAPGVEGWKDVDVQGRVEAKIDHSLATVRVQLDDEVGAVHDVSTEKFGTNKPSLEDIQNLITQKRRRLAVLSERLERCVGPYVYKPFQHVGQQGLCTLCKRQSSRYCSGCHGWFCYKNVGEIVTQETMLEASLEKEDGTEEVYKDYRNSCLLHAHWVGLERLYSDDHDSKSTARRNSGFVIVSTGISVVVLLYSCGVWAYLGVNW